MPKLKFTARGIEAIKPPKSGQVDYWDAGLPGFILRVSYGGKKAWCVSYRHEGRKRRLTLGTYPALSLADARVKAGDALREVAHSKDPAADKEAYREAETFGELANLFLEKHSKKSKKSWRVDERAFKRDLLPRFRHRRASSISRKEVIRLLDDIVDRGAPIQANRTLEILRKMYNWAMSRDIVEANPCAGVARPAEEHQRDRVLTDDEIKVVWNALDHEPPDVAAIFRLRLLTVQRGQEVTTIRHQDIDPKSRWWTIPPEQSKNNLAHRVPLSSQAWAVLEPFYNDAPADTVWLFPAPRANGPKRHLWRHMKSIRERSGVDFVPHDFRRTGASLMTGMRIGRLTVSKLLNHVETGVTAVYDRHSYDREKREALEAWGAHVEEIVAGERSAAADEKVVPLHTG